MKMIHTSDSQIKQWVAGGVNPKTGLNRRFEDALECFDFIIDYAIKEKIDYFIHGGDVNEHRSPDSVSVEQFAIRVKRITDAGIVLIVIAGNHDIDSALGCTTSISYLKALGIPNVYIADKSIEVFEFDAIGQPIRFLCLPFFYKSQLNMKTNDDVSKYIVDAISDFNKKHKDDDEYLNVCVAHYTVDRVFEGLEINEPIIPITAFGEFDYNAFGHIHKYMDFADDGVVGGYCGSPYRCSFGEKEEKYFNVVDFEEGSIDKVLIPNREFVDIVVDARDADQRGIDHFVVSKLKHMDLDNKFLKITIKSFERFNLRSVYEHLKERKIFHYMPIQFEKERVTVESRLTYDPTMDSIAVVKSFLSKQDIPDDFKSGVIDETSSAIKAVGI